MTPKQRFQLSTNTVNFDLKANACNLIDPDTEIKLTLH